MSTLLKQQHQINDIGDFVPNRQFNCSFQHFSERLFHELSTVNEFAPHSFAGRRQRWQGWINLLKDSASFDNQTIWALKMFHEILVDLAARAPTRNLTRVLVSSTISLAGDEGIGLQELSEELGIPVATVSYAVTALLKDGVLSQLEDESDARRHPTRYSLKERELTIEWAETVTMISVRMAVEVFGGVEPAIERFREIASQEPTPPPNV